MSRNKNKDEKDGIALRRKTRAHVFWAENKATGEKKLFVEILNKATGPHIEFDRGAGMAFRYSRDSWAAYNRFEGRRSGRLLTHAAWVRMQLEYMRKQFQEEMPSQDWVVRYARVNSKRVPHELWVSKRWVYDRNSLSGDIYGSFRAETFAPKKNDSDNLKK